MILMHPLVEFLLSLVGIAKPGAGEEVYLVCLDSHVGQPGFCYRSRLYLTERAALAVARQLGGRFVVARARLVTELVLVVGESTIGGGRE